MMAFLFLQYLLEKKACRDITFLKRRLYYLLVKGYGIRLILNILFYHLLESAAHENGGGLGCGYSPKVKEPLRNSFSMFHFGYADLFELIVNRKPFYPTPLDMLPHILDGHLQFSGNRLIQLAQKCLGYFGNSIVFFYHFTPPILFFVVGHRQFSRFRNEQPMLNSPSHIMSSFAYAMLRGGKFNRLNHCSYVPLALKLLE